MLLREVLVMNQRGGILSIGRFQEKFLRHYSKIFLILGGLLLAGGIGCRTVGGPPIPPCPVPSDGAYSELDIVADCCPGILNYLGRVELMCQALDDVRDE
jgi:hypothetical protein